MHRKLKIWLLDKYNNVLQCTCPFKKVNLVFVFYCWYFRYVTLIHPDGIPISPPPSSLALEVLFHVASEQQRSTTLCACHILFMSGEAAALTRSHSCKPKAGSCQRARIPRYIAHFCSCRQTSHTGMSSCITQDCPMCAFSSCGLFCYRPTEIVEMLEFHLRSAVFVLIWPEWLLPCLVRFLE